MTIMQSLRAHALRPTLGAALWLACAGAASATDVDSDDYAAAALPPGSNLALLYYRHAVRDRAYADGIAASGGDLVSDIAIARYARFVKLGPLVADPQFLLPFGGLHGTGSQKALGSASGVGDLILASTFWFQHDAKTGHFFGITPFITAPTGQYDHNAALSVGEHRWKFELQAGYITPVVTPRLKLMLAAGVTFFTRNNDYGPARQSLAQDPLGETQEWLTYDLTPKLQLRAGSFQYFGGAQSLDDIKLNASHTATVNFKVGLSYAVAPGWNLLALYGRDTEVQNGFREAYRLNFRIYKAF